jgi:hypothetical protein
VGTVLYFAQDCFGAFRNDVGVRPRVSFQVAALEDSVVLSAFAFEHWAEFNNYVHCQPAERISIVTSSPCTGQYSVTSDTPYIIVVVECSSGCDE